MNPGCGCRLCPHCAKLMFDVAKTFTAFSHHINPPMPEERSASRGLSTWHAATYSNNSNSNSNSASAVNGMSLGGESWEGQSGRAAKMESDEVPELIPIDKIKQDPLYSPTSPYFARKAAPPPLQLHSESKSDECSICHVKPPATCDCRFIAQLQAEEWGDAAMRVATPTKPGKGADVFIPDTVVQDTVVQARKVPDADKAKIASIIDYYSGKQHFAGNTDKKDDGHAPAA